MNPALQQLRDIHLPPPVSWWPPAPGWWALLLLAAGLATGLYLWRRRREQGRWRRHALAELERLRQLHAAKQAAPAAVVGALSTLLRRVALSRFPRSDVAALHGEDWLAFLDRTLGQETLFRSERGRILATLPYQPADEIDRQVLPDLMALVERWIRRLPARGRR